MKEHFRKVLHRAFTPKKQIEFAATYNTDRLQAEIEEFFRFVLVDVEAWFVSDETNI